MRVRVRVRVRGSVPMEATPEALSCCTTMSSLATTMTSFSTACAVVRLCAPASPAAGAPGSEPPSTEEATELAVP